MTTFIKPSGRSKCSIINNFLNIRISWLSSLPLSHYSLHVHTNRVYVMFIFSHSHRNTQHSIMWQELRTMDILYLFACIVMQIYCLFIHGIGGILLHLEFLTLLLTSFTCALGVVWTWLQSYSLYIL